MWPLSVPSGPEVRMDASVFAGLLLCVRNDSTAGSGGGRNRLARDGSLGSGLTVVDSIGVDEMGVLLPPSSA